MNDGIRVLAIYPFWRYAVVPENLQHREPAMPFYRKKSAMKFIAEAKAELKPVFDDYKMVLYRKVWFRQIEQIGIF